MLPINNKPLRGSMPSGTAPPRNKNAWTRRSCSARWRLQMVAVASLHLPPRSHRAPHVIIVYGAALAPRAARDSLAWDLVV